ncbi:MAG: hypothetical protein JNL42_14900, partial [Anaerolineae bacterium]|nr:hypothetical protein [Anaerolineae bacterium]
MEALRPLDGAANGALDLTSGVAAALAVGSMAALLRWRVNATLLILVGAGVGLALSLPWRG